MSQEIEKLFDADEVKAEAAEATEVPLARLPREHREATVLAFTTVLVGNKPLNITIREGWTTDEIDSIFDGLDYIGNVAGLRGGVFVTSNQFSTIEVDSDGNVTGMRKIPTVYDNGPKQAQPSEPVNSPFAPGDDAPVENKAQAPQQAKGKSDLIVFEVDHITWASMMPSKKYPGQYTTTFRVYDVKGYYHKFGVVCYPEALQKAGFDIGGATGGWELDLAGKGWFAHCFPGKELNQYGEYWPDKVAYFAQEQKPF